MSVSTEIIKKPKSYWIHTVICLVFMFGFGFLPPLGGAITPYGMQVLGIFIGTFYGWIFLEFMWPSLLGIVALGLTSYGTIPAVFAEGIKNESTLNILLMFIFAAYLEKSGSLSWVTYWMISRKSLVGHPWLFTTIFIAAIIPLYIFVNVYAGIVLLWGIFAGLCKAVGYTKKDLFVTYVCGGIAQVGGIVSIAFPFQPFSQLIFSLSGKAVGVTEIPFAQWSTMGIATIILYLLAYILLGRFVLKVDASRLSDMGDRFADYRGQKMDVDQKFGMVLLMIFISLLVLPTITSGYLKTLFGNFNVSGAAIFCLVVA